MGAEPQMTCVPIMTAAAQPMSSSTRLQACHHAKRGADGSDRRVDDSLHRWLKGTAGCICVSYLVCTSFNNANLNDDRRERVQNVQTEMRAEQLPLYAWHCRLRGSSSDRQGVKSERHPWRTSWQRKEVEPTGPTLTNRSQRYVAFCPS